MPITTTHSRTPQSIRKYFRNLLVADLPTRMNIVG